MVERYIVMTLNVTETVAGKLIGLINTELRGDVRIIHMDSEGGKSTRAPQGQMRDAVLTSIQNSNEPIGKGLISERANIPLAKLGSQLQALRNKGLIRRIGENRGKHSKWVVTAQGRADKSNDEPKAAPLKLVKKGSPKRGPYKKRLAGGPSLKALPSPSRSASA